MRYDCLVKKKSSKRAEAVAELLEIHKQTTQLLMRHAQQHTSTSNTTLSTVRILKILKEGEPKTQHDLAERLCISGGAVSRHITSLQDKGHVAATVNPNNRRETYISLTPAGARSLKAAEQTVLAHFVSLLEDLSDEELAAIVAANTKLQSTISKP